MAALYLRGIPRTVPLRRRGWPIVERVVRRADVSLERMGIALREAGLWAEALALEEPGLLSWAEKLVEEGRCLTVASRDYPGGWLRTLGDGAPPALWRDGDLPPGPLLGIAGSRQVEGSILAFAQDVAAEAVRLEYGIVSGGATGCDSAAATGGCRVEEGRVLEILPCGLNARASRGTARLAVVAPREPFSPAAAMERNALLYAAAERTVVVHARFKAGGTWTGATDALRRRLCPLIVREDASDLAHRSLLSLGGIPLKEPGELQEALLREEMQGKLLAVG